MDYFFKNWFFGNNRSADTHANERESVPGVPESTMPTDTPKVSGGSYSANIIRPVSQRAALTISAVYRATELRAKTEAQFVPEYQKYDHIGDYFAAENVGLGKRLNYLMQVQPNPTMTAASFWKQVVIQKLMLGNAIAYIERDEFGNPSAFWLSRYASYNIATGTYTLTYTSNYGVVTKNNVPAADVLHFLNTYTTPDGLWGYSTIKYAIDTLSLLKTEYNQALDSAAKGGRVKLLIGEDRTSNQGLLSGGLYDKEQTQKYAREINSEIYSQDVVSLRGLDKAQSISMTAQEMQMVELLGMGDDDVARFWATPRPLLMLDTNSHYTTYMNARMEYLTNTVQSDINEHEQELQRKFIGPEEFGYHRWHLCEQNILRLDKEAQAKVDEINLRTGVKNVNELRHQQNLPKVKDGQIHLVSTNLMQLGSIKAKYTNPNKNKEEKGGAA